MTPGDNTSQPGTPRRARYGLFTGGKVSGEGGGFLQHGSFVDQVRDGEWTRCHSTGAVIDHGWYARGKKTGEWVTYGPDGAGTKRKTFA